MRTRYNLRPHTNLPDDIDHHESPSILTDILVVFLLVLMPIILVIVLTDYVFGAEEVTNFIANIK